jgi:transcriptional repressor NrdR
VTEPFSRVKIMTGVRKACQGRPVNDDAIALLAQKVEETIRARGVAEIPSHDVGLTVLGPLRDLDEVAYLRFASVYRSFDSLADFEREIAALRAVVAARGGVPSGSVPAGAVPPGTQPSGAAPSSGVEPSVAEPSGAVPAGPVPLPEQG